MLKAFDAKVGATMYIIPKNLLIPILIGLISLNTLASTISIFSKELIIPKECVLKLNAHFANEAKLTFMCNEQSEATYWINVKTQAEERLSNEGLTDEQRREKIRGNIASLLERGRNGVLLDFDESELEIGNTGRYLSIRSACDKTDGLCLELVSAPEELVRDIFTKLGKPYNQ